MESLPEIVSGLTVKQLLKDIEGASPIISNWESDYIYELLKQKRESLKDSQNLLLDYVSTKERGFTKSV